VTAAVSPVATVASGRAAKTVPSWPEPTQLTIAISVAAQGVANEWREGHGNP